jgi:Escherichia/Staphylococcus phage prohead protease
VRDFLLTPDPERVYEYPNDVVGEERMAVEAYRATLAEMRAKAIELRAASELRQAQGYGCKSLACEVKAALQPYEFEGLASVYNVLDAQGDVVDPGAFAGASEELPLLWNHNVDEVIGKVVLSDSPTGLRVHGMLNMGVARAKEVWSLLMQRAVTGLSIGYSVAQSVYRDGARHLREINLHEVSVTPFPAQPLATVSAVKKGGATSPGRKVSRVSRKAPRYRAHDGAWRSGSVHSGNTAAHRLRSSAMRGSPGTGTYQAARSRWA